MRVFYTPYQQIAVCHGGLTPLYVQGKVHKDRYMQVKIKNWLRLFPYLITSILGLPFLTCASDIPIEFETELSLPLHMLLEQGRHNNQAYLLQYGARNSAVLLQSGLKNQLVSQQLGQENQLSVAQVGMKNQVSLTQWSAKNSAKVQQYGTGNQVRLLQANQENQTNISQFGDGNQVRLQQFGGARFSVEQLSDHATIFIMQY